MRRIYGTDQPVGRKLVVLDLFTWSVTAVLSDDYPGVGEGIRLASCVALGLEQQ